MFVAEISFKTVLLAVSLTPVWQFIFVFIISICQHLFTTGKIVATYNYFTELLFKKSFSRPPLVWTKFYLT